MLFIKAVTTKLSKKSINPKHLAQVFDNEKLFDRIQRMYRSVYMLSSVCRATQRTESTQKEKENSERKEI